MKVILTTNIKIIRIIKPGTYIISKKFFKKDPKGWIKPFHNPRLLSIPKIINDDK